jgi:DNA processing protein
MTAPAAALGWLDRAHRKGACHEDGQPDAASRDGARSDDRLARAAWSALAEPGDLVAGALVASLGAADALRLVAAASGSGVREAWAGAFSGVDGSPLLEGTAHGPRLERAVQRWAGRLADVDPFDDLDVLAALSGTLVVPGDAGWPRGLNDLGLAAPFGLWVRGSADLAGLLGRAVALVGARASTSYGERVAVDLAAGVVDAGASVVSGGAYGIDAAAHRGAIARDGRTVVVLAGGVDRAYPAGNARMFEAVVDTGGALVAEVPPGRAPTKGRFLQRNRLIAAAAGATVVVEAAWRSGAMSTAHHAARLLRPVGAVPGPVTSVASAGCHRLLREGAAVCVTDAAEVMELAGVIGDDLAEDPADAPRRADGLDPSAARVLDALSRRAGSHVEAVAARAGVTVREAQAALGVLELRGLAAREGSLWRWLPAKVR